ncbi:MAG: hypothetical protein U0821_24945 [Chloroflexota bacterium]
MFRDVNLDDLIIVNPRIENEMRQWQTERHQHGMDPLDWAAFRALQAELRAPDPGESAPAEFYWFSVPPTFSVERVAVRELHLATHSTSTLA